MWFWNYAVMSHGFLRVSRRKIVIFMITYYVCAPSQAVKRINRFLRFCDRFIECLRLACKMRSSFVRNSGADEKKCIRINGRRFFFPKSDKGVLTHLYKPGYRIKVT